ncbi:dioxygenase family protein [Sphaerimonospora thailandensis]|uniref:Dioxygenase n=1 Tax=Sphaerimonospora thailandensis TaxID=795644 RepID=A0A8J3R4R0_9ACTN|nr:carbohydrate-binding protein [Sphaerimonospora thailandensis]GIH68410.1 dioxygenase [Sphaerimonospora thailandensis]
MAADSANEPEGISRKSFMKAALVAAPIPLLLGATPLARAAVEKGEPLEPTPFCGDSGGNTPAQMEGPYFKPSSPLRSTLPGSGTLLTVSGYVFGVNCVPLANVLLDFWQADAYGNYDMQGYTFRGHQFTDSQGRYKLTTIVPGLYPGRTRHLHVKLQAPNKPILTTQTYFPGEPRNNTDSLYDSRLLMNVRANGSGREATFDFVLNVVGTPPTSPGPTPPPNSPSPTPTPPNSPPPGGGTWQAGTTYQAGATVTYGGSTYRCIQGHTALVGWEPPIVPALWQRI